MWWLLLCCAAHLNSRGKNVLRLPGHISHSNIAEEVKKKLVDGVKSFKMGTVEDFSNFINAVIDEKSFDKIKTYIDNARKDPAVKHHMGRRKMLTKQKDILLNPR